MLRISRAAAIAEEQKLASRSQTIANQKGGLDNLATAVAGDFKPQVRSLPQGSCHMRLCLFEVHLVISRSRLKKGLPSRHSTCADSQSVQLRHDRIHYFLNTDCGGRASIVAALIEKLLQKWRDNFFLQSVLIYFPWTSAGKNGNT